MGAPGCSVQGFVLVKKVPGNMHISAHSHKHSFDFSVMNMTHQVTPPETPRDVYEHTPVIQYAAPSATAPFCQADRLLLATVSKTKQLKKRL